jgi:diguanylate cyclase (GGDEF)-like protein/PAS domain S-box-containing protein
MGAGLTLAALQQWPLAAALLLLGGSLAWWMGREPELPETAPLDERLQRAAEVLENLHEGVLVTDAAGNIVLVNAAFSRITGYSEAEAQGRNPRFLQSGRHNQKFYEALWQTINTSGHWQGEFWNRRKSGEMYPQWENITAIRDEQGQIKYYVAFFSDISHLRDELQNYIVHAGHFLAHYDPLTGLNNRLRLDARLSYALERAQQHQRKVALLWIDLDRFRLINNSFSHHAGDRILVEMARRLREYIETLPTETTLARSGSDDFILAIDEIGDNREAARLARQILALLAKPWELDGQAISITASVGISLYPDDGATPESLMKSADAALSRAKQAGGNTHQFCRVDTTARVYEHLELESALWKALENREFIMYYQPQIDLGSYAIGGAEALARWKHPERGIVSPDKFIPLAEQSLLINHIGDAVLRAACLQNKSWQAAGLPPIRVGVNLSGRQIAQENIVEKVMAILHDSRLDPRWLKLEVTESLIIENPELAIINLTALKKLGISLSIDDFGVGYSSFHYLKSLPVDELKIDRSFIQGIPQDGNNCKITPAIIGIGHSLNLKVVAEGVENRQQLEFLAQHHCDTVQGFFFSKPVPAETLAEMFKQSFHPQNEAEFPE